MYLHMVNIFYLLHVLQRVLSSAC